MKRISNFLLLGELNPGNCSYLHDNGKLYTTCTLVLFDGFVQLVK